MSALKGSGKMNHLTQVKQATTSLTPSELRDPSIHIAALLAAEVATSANASTCASPTPGLNGRSNSKQTNGALNWWEREQDDARWQGEERSKYLGKVPVQACDELSRVGDEAPTLVAQRLVA